jgi:hypothetical protein
MAQAQSSRRSRELTGSKAPEIPQSQQSIVLNEEKEKTTIDDWGKSAAPSRIPLRRSIFT